MSVWKVYHWRSPHSSGVYVWYGLFDFGPPFVKRFALCYRTVVLSCLVRLSVTLVYCGQTVGWITMKRGTKVGLCRSHTVLDGDPAPPKTGRSSPNKGHIPQFSAHVRCGQTAVWIKMPLGSEVGLGPGHIVLDEDPAPPKKGAQHPILSPCILWPNG